MLPLTLDSICFHKGFINIAEEGEIDNISYASTVQSLIMKYGYMLTSEAMTTLRWAPQERIMQFYTNVIEFLKAATGGKHTYVPLYGDFPNDMMSEKDAWVMMDAINYHSEKGSFDSFSSVMDKPIKYENIEYKKIKEGNQGMADAIFTDLVSINTSILPQDMEVVKWFVNSGLTLIMPARIPFKENLCTLAAMNIQGLPIKTPTDVLRIAVHMSGGDISLPAVPPATITKKVFRSIATVENGDREKFRFKKFKRPERRLLLGLLEQTNCNPAEMVLKDQRWIRLGEILHPGEYAEKYPKAFKAFNAIRNTKVTSWYGKLTKAINTQPLGEILDILAERPGEFARRLDYMIRTFGHDDTTLAMITNAFADCYNDVSNKVLYELLTHFSKRDEPVTNRTIMIKGARKLTPLPDLPALPKKAVRQTIDGIVAALQSKFAVLDKLGKVWVDPELFKIPLPTNMRSINFSLVPTIRGQRTPIKNTGAKVLRAYFHWNDKHGVLDPDLSVTFVGEGIAPRVLSYSNTRVGKSVHSGDIIARRGYCAEYIDIDIKEALELGYKYVVCDVRNYRGHSQEGGLSIMDGTFGIMEREYPQSGTSWLPETVVNSNLCQSKANDTLLAIIDLKAMEYIFLDIDSSGSVTARGDIKSILAAVKQYTENPAISVGHLLMWHGEARGELVQKQEDAETAFEAKDFMSSYEKAGSYMGI